MAYLGIDIGTSGCKALALSSAGEILATHTATYGLDQPRPGWTQQDPAIWVKGARDAVSKVLETVPVGDIKCIGLSGQMHGFTPLDANGEVLRPAILWNDQRNAAEAQEIEERAGGREALLSLTNNRMLVGYTGGKIVWMQVHEPKLFDQVRHALNPKDYLRYVLTGEVATEVSDASGTGLFDVRERQWCQPLIDKLPFDSAILPPCYESMEVSGTVSALGASLFGLTAGIPVIGGGGDSVIQTLGTGVAEPGPLQTTIGTAGITAAALDAPKSNPDGRMQVFCNVAPDLWHCMGVSLNAGGALGWLRQLLGGTQDFEDMVRGAGEVPAGAEGLVFLPYLNGERCPHPDPTARGAFVGLSARHDARHMTRALMEGVVFALYDIYRQMAGMGINGRLIKASGGGARSEIWRQMQADMFGCPVVTIEGAAEGGAFGAALLAGVSLGNWSSITEAAGCCSELTRQSPSDKQHELYGSAYEIYAELYPALQPSFAALNRMGDAI
ncbi:xylulokinase [Hoeflea sp.]|uniref:xylulokinase n=1 Tax=Hoeflea sp. TaxID=1940281 RepID=UPI003A8DCC8F